MEQRIIKFRAFNEQMNRMDYFGLGDTVPYYYKDENSPAISYEVMQFTGLTDKNGKEIYEGDIVKFDYNSTPISNHIGVVEWDNHNCSWIFDNLYLEPTPRETMEVIGNIYENENLLTK